MDIWNSKYDIIVVDPPWDIGKIRRSSRPLQGSTLNYPTMSIEDIKDLPIPLIADNPSWLFLWTINQYLEQSFKIMRYWEFTFHIMLTWDKQNGMCLYGFHRRTEFILAGYRGTPIAFPTRKAIPTIFAESSWGKHSVKPGIFYQLIEPLGSRRVDIFARKQRPGWDVWGNEVQ